MNEPIFNAHAHIYPEKIAAKAVNAIGDFYDIKMELDGTADGLVRDGKASGVEYFAVCSVATDPSQVAAINGFIARQCEAHPGFTGLGAVHPGCENVTAVVDEIAALGMKGIKLHPDFQRFRIDDESAMPIYAAAQGRLPVLFHTGDDRVDFSDPRRLLRVLDRFPELTVIAAHLGGYRVWDIADCLLGHPQVYIDTSSALPFMDARRAADIIRRHGVERTLFGTDYPMWTHAGELDRFAALGLTEKEKRAVLWDNAARLFVL